MLFWYIMNYGIGREIRTASCELQKLSYYSQRWALTSVKKLKLGKLKN